MNVLEICQQVAREIPLAVPTALLGSSDETASLLLGCAQTMGKRIMRAHNWEDLVTEYTFSTVASQADYDLPSDYDRLFGETLWDRDNYERIRGPLSASQWQEYKSSVLASTNTVWKRFRIRNVSGNRKFSIHPTPDAVETLVYEYISNQWCKSSVGTRQSTIQNDEDELVIDDYLFELGVKYWALYRLGLGHEQEKRDYESELSQSIARDGGTKTLTLSGRRRYHLLGPQNIQDSGFG